MTTSSMPGYSPLPEEETHADYIARTHTLAAQQRRLAAVEAGGQPSSQVEYPWRAALRTGVQATVAALGVLAVVVPTVLVPWLEENSLGLDPALVASLLGVCAAFVSVATLVSRVMALPAVDAWVRTYLRGAAPSPTERPQPEQG